MTAWQYHVKTHNSIPDARIRSAAPAPPSCMQPGNSLPTGSRRRWRRPPSTHSYRYFPTQDTLLLEIGIDAGVDDLEARVAAPRNAGEAPTDLVQIISALNGLVLENEAQYRRMLQLYLEVWLRATENDDVEPVVRQGRRMRWFEQILEPLRASVDPARFDRLLAALCLTAGSEAVVALRDVARLSPADVVETTAWVVQVLVDATFADPA
jgi:AcrR family transcriptional regulator